MSVLPKQKEMKNELVYSTSEEGPNDPLLTKRTIWAIIFSMFFGPGCITGVLVCIAYAKEIDRFVQKVLLYFWL